MARWAFWACIALVAMHVAPAGAFSPAAQPLLLANRGIASSRTSTNRRGALGVRCMAAAADKATQAPLQALQKVAAPALATLASLFATAGGLPAALLISLIASSVGFISAVYFVGYGYGLSMMAMGGLALRHFSAAAPVSQLALYHACMVIAWGARIFGFLLYREAVAWPGLRARTKETNKKFSPSARVSTWLFVSLFYALLFSPALFHIQTPTALPVLTQAGLAIGGAGLLLEAQSDQAKSAFKKTRGNDFMSTGLYKLCRHPNYLGECIFWSGSFVCGVGSLTSPLQWSVASAGLAGIIAIMLKATESLEKKQALKYGDRADYQQYVSKTPKLIPFMGGDDAKGIVTSAKEAEKQKEAEAAAKADATSKAKKADATNKATKADVTSKAAPQASAKAEPAAPASSDKKAGAKGAAADSADPKLDSPPSNYAKNKKPWDI